MASRTAAGSPGTERADRRATLLVCMFHLNLAYSSLEEADQAEVVALCYRPMLALAERAPFPIAIEASGWTLEQIAAHDPDWIAQTRELIRAGRVELVGSGYAQCAAPLLPAEVNRWNLRLGFDSYAELLDTRPRVALISEQAYSPGLVDIYREAGFEAVIADWDNAYRSHLNWDRSLRQHPQLARGTDGSIPLLWSESIAFQKFQRHAHGEMTLDDYVRFVAETVADGGGALMLYANDAEVFDRRPGRFAAEPELAEREWDRIAAGLHAIDAAGLGTPALPSDVLATLEPGEPLALEAPAQPIPVKKQEKYNISRWAVTGRDDVGINTRCWRIYDALRSDGNESAEDWRELCALWASDFRTHITQARWSGLLERLAAMEARVGVTPTLVPAAAGDGVEAPPAGVELEGRLLRIRRGELEVVLNTRRGLAIASFVDRSIGEQSLFGGIDHGYFELIELSADWYTGNLVQEAPLRQKVTDLEPMTPRFSEDGDTLTVHGVYESPLGLIEKSVAIDGAAGSVELTWTLRWSELPPGSLRLGHLTLNPEAFDIASLWYATHNGGASLERHALGGEAFDHGSSVSALVSARIGLGVTEGLLLIGDAEHHVRVEIDQNLARPLGLVNFHPTGQSYFLRAAFSLTESDDTRRGGIPRPADQPQRARVRFSARAGD
ncbi:MAG TPA: hypothetical protein VKS25_10990 [Solirubrobacteraceae bacterium]|nr:hypothetical protein [Solirubrobacteraceae bacterium]